MSEIGFFTIFTGVVIPVITGILYVRRSRKIDTYNRVAENSEQPFMTS